MLPLVCLALLFAGCSESTDKADKVTRLSETPIPPGTTVGDIADAFSPEVVPVQGIALIGGLKGTGSAECPARVRNYLTQYILKQAPKENVNKLINSKDTAVVIVESLMPTSVTKNERFDVSVRPIEGTQTTSLAGGQLLGTELRAAGAFGLTAKVLARAAGAV